MIKKGLVLSGEKSVLNLIQT